MKFLNLIFNGIARLFWASISELSGWFSWIAMSLPSTPLGNRIRCFYWSKTLGLRNLRMVGRNAEIITRDPLVVGKNFLLGEGVVIDNCDSSGCFIGNEVAIARGSYIRTGNHSFNRFDLPIMFQGHTSQAIFYEGHQYSVVIEDDVWIGANVVILSGTHISRGCVIAAGSVLMGFVPPFSIFAGNPGRVIGKRE